MHGLARLRGTCRLPVIVRFSFSSLSFSVLSRLPELPGRPSVSTELSFPPLFTFCGVFSVFFRATSWSIFRRCYSSEQTYFTGFRPSSSSDWIPIRELITGVSPLNSHRVAHGNDAFQVTAKTKRSFLTEAYSRVQEKARPRAMCARYKFLRCRERTSLETRLIATTRHGMGGTFHGRIDATLEAAFIYY